MKIDINKIKENLATKNIARNIIYIEEIDSTQDEAKRNLDSLSDGTYIVTDKQTKGKGTHGRVWYDKGYENICGSFVLKPGCDISKIDGLTTLIAKCIVKALKETYEIDVSIKEPNDIILNSKKLAGILTESVTSNGIVKSIIVGIGLNVSQLDFDKEIVDLATSLKKEFGRDFDRELIISEFFNIFEKEYYKLIE